MRARRPPRGARLETSILVSSEVDGLRIPASKINACTRLPACLPDCPSHRQADALRAAQAGHGVEKKINHEGRHGLRGLSVKPCQLVRRERITNAGR